MICVFHLPNAPEPHPEATGLFLGAEPGKNNDKKGRRSFRIFFTHITTKEIKMELLAQSSFNQFTKYHLDLPGVVEHFAKTLQLLSEQGLSPDAVLIEDAANGPAVCQLLRRQIPGLITIRPVGSKSSRSNAAAPLREAGHLAFNHCNDGLI